MTSARPSRATARRSVWRLAAPLLTLALVTTACSSEDEPKKQSQPSPGGVATSAANAPELDPNAGAVKQSDGSALAEAPELGVCRALSPADVEQPANDTDTVDCGDEQHTAQTFVVGSFPEKLTRGAGWGSPKLGAYIYGECTDRFGRFVGGDESIRMRALVSWAWFRPTKEQWSNGARWFRCDIVGGSPVATSYASLPETSKGLFSRGPVDTWMQCVNGKTIGSAPATPCTQEHTWRAVSTIVVGDKKDEYPGDRVVESRSQSNCSESVKAIVGYPEQFEFAYSWFHEAEWEAGNRRSVCWAKTSA